MDIHQIRKLQIGRVTLPNNLILGPMAGVTDLPFRLLCKEQGAGLLCMEMVSAKAISFHNKEYLFLLLQSRVRQQYHDKEYSHLHVSIHNRMRPLHS